MDLTRMAELLINTATAAATVILSVFAYREIRQSERERRSNAIAVRYLLYAEVQRLARPYKEMVRRWHGAGYRDTQGMEFPATSDVLREGLAQMHLLTQEEQRALATFALVLSNTGRQGHQNRFEADEKGLVERLVSDAAAATRAIERRLPQYEVTATQAVAYEATKGVAPPPAVDR